MFKALVLTAVTGNNNPAVNLKAYFASATLPFLGQPVNVSECWGVGLLLIIKFFLSK